MALKVCDSKFDTPKDELNSLVYSILFHLQVYKEQTAHVQPLFLDLCVVKINFRRMVKPMFSTLS